MSLEQKNPGKNAKSLVWLTERPYLKVSQEKLTLSRNMSLGSAGVALLAIFRLSLAETLEPSLGVALYAFSLATPLFVALSFWYEVFIWMGEESYPHFSASRAAMSRWAWVPMLALYVGISATIWHLSILAALVFIAASIVSIFILEKQLARVGSSLN